jgi:hypothetical protein
MRTTNVQLPKRPIRLKFASCDMAAEGFISSGRHSISAIRVEHTDQD